MLIDKEEETRILRCPGRFRGPRDAQAVQSKPLYTTRQVLVSLLLAGPSDFRMRDQGSESIDSPGKLERFAARRPGLLPLQACRPERTSPSPVT